MIRIGLAGIGFMGWIHWLAYRRLPGIQVTAIHSRDARKRSGDWRAIRGNFGPPGEIVNLDSVRVHAEWNDLLNDPEVDCIDICLPPAQHVSAALAVAAAGKHIFCEKPLALDVADCDRILAAARAHQIQLFVGHVLPFFPEYAWLRGVLGSGQYGKILGGTFKRVISNPDWLPDFFDPRVVGGPLLDLHVHDAHLIRWLFGMPRGLYCQGRWRGACVEYAQTVFDFGDRDRVVGSVMGVTHQPARPFTHGFEVHLQDATLHFEFAAFTDQGETMALKLFDRQGQVLRPDLGPFDPVDGFAAEIAEVRDCLNQQRPSDLLNGELARDAILLCRLQAESAAAHSYCKVPQ